MESVLSELFESTTGNQDISDKAAEDEFLENFKVPYVGVNGQGPILNANANLIPTVSDNFRDISNTLDHRLPNGIGVSKFYRKTDSQGGQVRDGFQGYAKPSKMFGRDSRQYDLNYKRDEMEERAKNILKQMGSKNYEVPQYADYFPWQWNDLNALGIGGASIQNPNQYNRNHSLPDADSTVPRLYQPAPSRMTKMLPTDIEVAALRPNSTLMHPMKVISEDRQREKYQRVPRNSDVREAVLYENIMPRGMGSRQNGQFIHSDSDALRQPIGTNETADRSVYGRWQNGFSFNNPLVVSSLEDRLIQYKNHVAQVEGKDYDLEKQNFHSMEKRIDSQY